MRRRCVTKAPRTSPARAGTIISGSGGSELLLAPSPTALLGGCVTAGVAGVADGLADRPADAPADALADRLADALAHALADALADALAEALAEAAAAALADAMAVSVGEVKHVVVIVSLSKVTSPVLASARPSSFAPVFIQMDVEAMIVPTKVEPTPRVAELVTCQKTLHELAPRMRFTELPDAVMKDEVVWMIQTELGSFWPSSVTVPVRLRTAPPAL